MTATIINLEELKSDIKNKRCNMKYFQQIEKELLAKLKGTRMRIKGQKNKIYMLVELLERKTREQDED